MGRLELDAGEKLAMLVQTFHMSSGAQSPRAPLPAGGHRGTSHTLQTDHKVSGLLGKRGFPEIAVQSMFQ